MGLYIDLVETPGTRADFVPGLVWALKSRPRSAEVRKAIDSSVDESGRSLLQALECWDPQNGQRSRVSLKCYKSCVQWIFFFVVLQCYYDWVLVYLSVVAVVNLV